MYLTLLDQSSLLPPQAPEDRGVSGSGFHLPRVYTPRRAGSQILALRLPYFLHAPTQKSKDLEKSANSFNPKAGKAIGKPKELLPYISLQCVSFKFVERLIYARVEPIVDPMLPHEQADFRTGG